jgi:GntR family transcriptional repressor for pyruvate dehydrogenase complex
VAKLEGVRVGSLQPLRLPKMAELIADQLRKQIVKGELVEGEVLPSEAELLERFSVSRPTLREAFRVLESQSLITVRRGAHGGARVQVPDIEVAARYAGFVLEHRGTTLADVYQARLLIEPPIVGLLASRRTEEDVQRLREALAEHEAAAHAPMRAIRSHTAFHALLVELTRNETLRVLTGMVQQIIDRANWDWVESKVATSGETGISLGLKAHHRVVDLIEAGGRAGAEEVWRKHLSEARDYLVRPDVTTVLDLMG